MTSSEEARRQRIRRMSRNTDTQHLLDRIEQLERLVKKLMEEKMSDKALIEHINELKGDLETMIEGCTRLVLVVQDQSGQSVDLGDGYILRTIDNTVVLVRGDEQIQTWEAPDIRSVYFAAERLKTSDFVKRRSLRGFLTTKQERRS